MDSVPVPDLDGKATGAFLVKDIRQQCRSFLDSLGSLLMDSEGEQDQHGVKPRKIDSEHIQECDTDVPMRKNSRKRRKTSKGAGFGDGAKEKEADTAEVTNERGKEPMENNIEDLKLESEVEALRRLKAGLESKGDSGNEFIRTTMEGERVEISSHQPEANNRIVECYMHTKEHVDEQYKTLIHEMQEERKSQYEQALKILRSLRGQSKTLSVRSRLKERLPPQETPNDKHKESRKDSSRPLLERRDGGGDLFHNSQPSSNFGLSSGSDHGREPCISNGPTNSVTAKSTISGEIVVHLAVYLPQAPSTPGEEWLVLGSQPLTLLRDALYCLNEQNMRAVEEQENASRLNGLHQDKLRLVENSSYFYFEGTFYIDQREPNAHDLSRSLRSYLAAENIAAPPHPVSQSGDNTILSTSFSTRPMEETLFEDLYIRLGSGVAGLYCHLGGCEHLVVVKDVRMHNLDVDPPLTSQYPYQIRVPSRTLVSLRYCEVCDRHAAQKVTYEDKKAPHTPFFWCNECFRLMHYDAQGHAKYTDYKVFPYLHDYQANLLHGHAYFKGRNTLQTDHDLERRETDP